MLTTAGSVLLALALLAAPAAPLTAAPATARHSGTVATMDAQSGVMIVDEMGPWRAENGRAAVTPLTIVLTAETKVNAFIRVNVEGAFAGDFIEVALEPADVSIGDFVTVECVRKAGRLVAVAVTLAELN